MGEKGSSHGIWMGDDRPGLGERGLVGRPGKPEKDRDRQKKQIMIPYLA